MPIKEVCWLDLTFFFLDEKEPKNQDKPDPSARFVGLSTPGRKPAALIGTTNKKLAGKRSINKNCWLQDKEACKVCT